MGLFSWLFGKKKKENDIKGYFDLYDEKKPATDDGQAKYFKDEEPKKEQQSVEPSAKKSAAAKTDADKKSAVPAAAKTEADKNGAAPAAEKSTEVRPAANSGVKKTAKSAAKPESKTAEASENSAKDDISAKNEQMAEDAAKKATEQTKKKAAKPSSRPSRAKSAEPTPVISEASAEKEKSVEKESSVENEEAPESEISSDKPIASTEEKTAAAAKKTGRFEIKKTKDGRFVFNLYAPNSVIVATSQVYSSSQSAVNGIESIIANAAKAPVEDQTAKSYTVKLYPKWELYTDSAGRYRFRLNAPNGNCIVHSQGYTTKASCKNGIESIIRCSVNPEIDKSYLKK